MEKFITTLICMIVFTSLPPLALAATTEIPFIIPEPVKFECRVPEKENNANLTVFLLKDQAEIVTVILTNSSILVDTDSFSATLDGIILSLTLMKSSLEYEGKFMCMWRSNDTEETGNEFFLQSVSKPTVKTNATSVKIFGGESVYIGCEANGKPMPVIEWLFNGMILSDNSSKEVFSLWNAKKSDSGLYSCHAKNKYGEHSADVKVEVMSQYPGKPMLSLVSRNRSSLTLSGKKPVYVGRGNLINKLRLKYRIKTMTKEIDREANFIWHIADLEPSASYTFELTACNPFVCGESIVKSFQTVEPVPAAPDIISVKATCEDDVGVVVAWTPSLYPKGPQVSYTVFYKRRDLDDTKWKMVDVPDKGLLNHRFSRSLQNAESFTLRNLLPLIMYEIKVCAANGSLCSQIESIKTHEAAPGKARNLTLVSATHTSLTVRWLPPLPPFQKVDCYRVTAYFGGRTIVSEQGSNIEYKMTIESLVENTTYDVTLYASLKRNCDIKILEGPSIRKTFKTLKVKPTPTRIPTVMKKTGPGNTSLILATVICILVIIVVTLAALLYCKKKHVFDVNCRSVFYVEAANRSLASRLSLRSVERKPPAISVEDFPEHVAELHADSDYLFSEEFYSLGPSRPDFTWEHSTLHLNRCKNRYQDIVAYDHTRVRLMTMDGVPASNYINANFIDGFEKKPAYIATQAPLDRTIEDFWRMVWEQDVRLIVMLTNLMERGKRKCDQYWPHNGEISYGVITVRTIEERKYACYVHRVFSISWNDAESAKGSAFDDEDVKIVRQFHFTDWPDFGVPQERSAMLSFVHMVRRYMQENESPTIVHCSAGVGRSGTFIVLESQIERINRKHNVNIYGFLKDIRSQRNFLVQQEVQYIFIHDALVDYIRCGLTAVPVSELENIHEEYYFQPNPDTGYSVIDEEWQIINEFSIHEFEMVTGRRPCNQQKNRDSFIIPRNVYESLAVIGDLVIYENLVLVDASRVRLTMKGATEGTDYINANYIDSFLRKKAFIVTQMPLYDTIEDFWRMIWENFSQLVVSLLTDEECSKEDLLSYLPRPDCNPINFGTFEIHCLSECKEEHYRLRELEVVGRVERGESERRKVFHFQLMSWPENKFPNVDHVIGLIAGIKSKKEFINKNRSSPDSPVVVHCSCGIGRSGVFCAVSNIKDQMDDFEETVDVFSTVRMLRRQRPLIIQNKASYEYLYQAALKYKDLMPAYPVKREEEDFAMEIPKSPMEFSEEVQKLISNMEEDSDSDFDV